MSPLGDLARQDDYLPDVGPPLIPGGPQFSPGVPAVNQAMGALLAPRPRDPNSPIAYRTASPLVNITEQDIADATEAAMASSGGGLGIKAYHSSPHDFEKFDLSKIGSGEGAQMYGHGLYFAENPAVSGQGGEYWKQFANRFSPGENTAAIHLAQAGFDRPKAAQNLRDMLANPNETLSEHNLKTVQNLRQRALSLLEGDKPVGPRTYEVDIKADPAHFLDWDKALARQSGHVQSALEKRLGIKTQPEQMRKFDDELMRALTTDANVTLPKQPYDPTGAEIYRDKIGPASVATRQLNEAGIPGIKYLDQSSRNLNVQMLSPNETTHGQWVVKNIPNGNVLYRGADEAAAKAAYAAAPKPSSNYVVFDPNRIDILRKYGIVGAAPLGMGALAAQDQYNQP